MESKNCFFIGHREAGEEISKQLAETVERHIREYGVNNFTVGNYGGFDRLSASAVIAAKEIHPDIRLFLLLPYHPSERHVEVPSDFDGTFYPPGMESVPKRLAIVRANRYMIDHSDYLIAYAWHPASNARNLVEYARKREKHEEIHITLIDHPRE